MSKVAYITKDVNLIRAVLNTDNIYEKLAYDNSPPLHKYIPDGLWFILKEGREVAGAIKLDPLNNVLWTPHIFIFEKYRGGDSLEWGRLVIKEMRKKFNAEKFLAFTPYETAKKYAEKLGFKVISILTKSIQKNGQLLDQYVLEK